jgi:hypothetical protein
VTVIGFPLAGESGSTLSVKATPGSRFAAQRMAFAKSE